MAETHDSEQLEYILNLNFLENVKILLSLHNGCSAVRTMKTSLYLQAKLPDWKTRRSVSFLYVVSAYSNENVSVLQQSMNVWALPHCMQSVLGLLLYMYALPHAY